MEKTYHWIAEQVKASQKSVADAVAVGAQS
jgi:hypothetical protein